MEIILKLNAPNAAIWAEKITSSPMSAELLQKSRPTYVCMLGLHYETTHDAAHLLTLYFPLLPLLFIFEEIMRQ